ncbi:MAG: M1 family metallopeptidase [Gemmatimonadota bacterium]
MTAFAALLLAAAAQQAPADTAYFQQGVAYRIEARLDEAAEVLHGRARLRYENRSPFTLDTLWLHLHLNAFRPHSRWAERELEYGERRFTDLGPDEHAFERLTRVEAGGRSIAPVYPLAPDSTVVGFPLPRALGTGDTLTVEVDWDARPSTLPRRQGRRDRHYDFAQWYPRLAVVDRGGWRVQPLMPQGEFYGEFGSFDVTLELAADQVVGATGVPVDGDPGWAAARHPRSAEPWYRRDYYASEPAERLGLLEGAPAAGHKQVRWRAEEVHHFAWSANPDYGYDGGRWEDIAIHVLFQPGDDDWVEDHTALERTRVALDWFHELFGDFPWPQLTNLHRIEGGGTEFPMMVMDGSASQGLILHEVAHNYVHGIFGNNEWLEGWLDEGFSSFLSAWWVEEHEGGDPWAGAMRSVVQREQAGATQPIGLAGADFVDPGTYSAMTYTKPQLVYRMLRWLMGEEDFRRGLRTYFALHQLQHVREADFRASMEAWHPEPLDWFFEQWIRTTDQLDYRVGAASLRQEGGQWVATVEVIREGDIWMPVDLRVGDETIRLESRERTQAVRFTLDARPAEAVLDPERVLIDVQPDNNRRAF